MIEIHTNTYLNFCLGDLTFKHKMLLLLFNKIKSLSLHEKSFQLLAYSKGVTKILLRYLISSYSIPVKRLCRTKPGL